MHGIIFSQLRKFVRDSFGEEGWARIVAAAGTGRDTYLMTQAYSDEELAALAAAGSQVSGRPLPELLEQFGVFLVPDLLKVYGSFIQPEWKTLDVLEHTESSIHKAVRVRDPEATPPHLKVARPTPNEVVITYSSPRRLCPVGVGIIKGVAAHYGEAVTVRQTDCMLRGNKECAILVERHSG